MTTSSIVAANGEGAALLIVEGDATEPNKVGHVLYVTNDGVFTLPDGAELELETTAALWVVWRSFAAGGAQAFHVSYVEEIYDAS